MIGVVCGLLLRCVALLLVAAPCASASFELDAPPGRVVSSAYFGLHIHHLVRRGLPQDPPLPTPWPGADVGALRLWDSSVRWAELEPSAGRWQFERLDAYLAAASGQGVPVIYTLGSTPQWASARPGEACSYGMGCAAEPRDLADWDRYVTTLARRYKGRIAWYEVWNEPHPGQSFVGRGFYNGSTEMLVTLARRAHAVLQREDPAARLLPPAFVNREAELERFLAQGGAEWVHGLSYHFYASGERQLLDRFKRVRASQQRHGLAGLPIFNTEASFEVVPAEHAGPGNPARSPSQAAAHNARGWVVGTVLGLDGWYHHGWDGRTTGMVDRGGQKTPTGVAWQAVRRWLVGARPLHCRPFDGAVVQCSFLSLAGPLWLLWRTGEPGQAQTVMLPEAWRPKRIERLLDEVPSTDAAVPQSLLVGDEPVAIWGAAGPATGPSPR